MSRKIQTSAVCSRSNSLTWRLLLRAVLFQWMRLYGSPGAYGRMPVACGVVCGVRTGLACDPSMNAGGSFQPGSGSTRGYTIRFDALPTDACDSNMPSGSPVRSRTDSTRKWPRRVSGTRTDHDFSLRGPRLTAWAGSSTGRVDGLRTSSHSLGSRLVFRTV